MGETATNKTYLEAELRKLGALFDSPAKAIEMVRKCTKWDGDVYRVAGEWSLGQLVYLQARAHAKRVRAGTPHRVSILETFLQTSGRTLHWKRHVEPRIDPFREIRAATLSTIEPKSRHRC